MWKVNAAARAQIKHARARKLATSVRRATNAAHSVVLSDCWSRIYRLLHNVRQVRSRRCEVVACRFTIHTRLHNSWRQRWDICVYVLFMHAEYSWTLALQCGRYWTVYNDILNQRILCSSSTCHHHRHYYHHHHHHQSMLHTYCPDPRRVFLFNQTSLVRYSDSFHDQSLDRCRLSHWGGELRRSGTTFLRSQWQGSPELSQAPACGHAWTRLEDTLDIP